MPAQLREQRLEPAPPEAAAKSLPEISSAAPPLTPSCSWECRCVPEGVTAVPGILMHESQGERGLVKSRRQPRTMLWKDGGFFPVLRDGIRQHLQHCSTRSQNGGVQRRGMEKGVLVVPAAMFVFRLWSLLLWKRFADPVTPSLACSTPSGGGEGPGDKGKVWGHTVRCLEQLWQPALSLLTI